MWEGSPNDWPSKEWCFSTVIDPDRPELVQTFALEAMQSDKMKLTA